MKKNPKQYTTEFRDDAVGMMVTSGKSVAQVVGNLCISVPTLHDWCRQARYDHCMPVPE
jgi:transposase-like protein